MIPTLFNTVLDLSPDDHIHEQKKTEHTANDGLKQLEPKILNRERKIKRETNEEKKYFSTYSFKFKGVPFPCSPNISCN